MRHIILSFAVSLILLSCDQNEAKQKEPGLKENQIGSDTSIKSADPVDTTTHTSEQKVLDIREEVTKINSTSLTAKKYKFFCDTDATATYFTDKEKVVKIAIDWGFIGDGSSTSEYYFKDDKLIFIYNTTTGGCANCPVTKTEYRTYVHNDRTIKQMENQKVISCSSCEFNENSKEYKALKAYNTNNVKSALCN